MIQEYLPYFCLLFFFFSIYRICFFNRTGGGFLSPLRKTNCRANRPDWHLRTNPIDQDAESAKIAYVWSCPQLYMFEDVQKFAKRFEEVSVKGTWCRPLQRYEGINSPPPPSKFIFILGFIWTRALLKMPVAQVSRLCQLGQLGQLGPLASRQHSAGS